MKSPFIWDSYSDQPHVIRDKAYKKQMKKKHSLDYLKLVISTAFVFPIATTLMKVFKPSKPKGNDIYGIGVNLDKGDVQVELIEELGVKNLLIRLPLSDIQNIQKYYDFTLKFIQNGNKQIVINILQDREHIDDSELLQEDISIIFNTFKTVTNEFQIGNAINRTKWGFFSIGEYLKFYKYVQDIRDSSFKNIKLIGPSVIDFEYYYTVRALFNGYDISFDKLSSLLYVDRRGSPYSTQMGIFDTSNKIDLLYALTRLSPKTKSDDIYITEVNWPLSNTAPYAPTSEKECVGYDEYAKYMVEYYDIARKSGKISKVFWHQLIAPGYGLVDNRDGKIIKTKAFYEFKKMVQNG
ncbi:MAG: hypothetical protein M0P43_09685 [Arcobacteraceae bacterium]|nr:hypothetical protein [Arcobacteraceae bacterium]